MKLVAGLSINQTLRISLVWGEDVTTRRCINSPTEKTWKNSKQLSSDSESDGVVNAEVLVFGVSAFESQRASIF